MLRTGSVFVVVAALLAGPVPAALAAPTIDGQVLHLATGWSELEPDAPERARDGTLVLEHDAWDCQAATFEAAGDGAYGLYDGTFVVTGSLTTSGWPDWSVVDLDSTFAIATDDDITISGTLAALPGGETHVSNCYVNEKDNPETFYFRVTGFVAYEAEISSSPGTTYAGAASFVLECSGVVDQSGCSSSKLVIRFGANPPPPPPVPSTPTMIVSNSLGSSIGSFAGTMAGSFSCGAQSTLEMDVAGNAYGPYPGTFTESVQVVLQNDTVQSFDIEFQINSGDTTVTGTAAYLEGSAGGSCGSHDDEDDGLVHSFSAGALVRYTATIDDGQAPPRVEQGWAAASVNLRCFGTTTFDSDCEPATSTFVWLEAFIGENGEASTGDGVSEENTSVVSVDNPADGRVEITPVGGAESTSSYMVLGQSYLIEAANAASVEDPIRLTFQIHSSLLYDWETDSPIDPSTVTVIRDGQPALNCASAAFTADPDPCVHSRAVDDDGNLTLVVLTSHASLWSVVALLGGDPTAAAIAEAVQALPAAAFKGRGHSDALVSRLTDVQQSIDAGHDATALRQLANLRRHVDGCGTKADKDDWIVSCPAQLEIRSLIDELMAHLGG
jgi:hypothetical protein